MEKVIIIKIIGKMLSIVGTICRDFAHKNRLCHITVICIAFIADGVKRGNVIVSNTLYRQIAKLRSSKDLTEEEIAAKTKAIVTVLNFPGGHCTPEREHHEYVTESMLFSSLRKELSEELLFEVSEETRKSHLNVKRLDVWEGDHNGEYNPTGQSKYALPCHIPLFAPIPIGFAEHDGEENVEQSYVFAVPISSKTYQKLLIADDYIDKGGIRHDLLLPHKDFPIDELRAKIGECQDAITRILIKPDLLQKLTVTINGYDGDGI